MPVFLWCNAGAGTLFGLDQPLAREKAHGLTVGGARGSGRAIRPLLVGHQITHGKLAGNDGHSQSFGHLCEGAFRPDPACRARCDFQHSTPSRFLPFLESDFGRLTGVKK